MKFWNRFTRLHIGSKVITSSDLDIFFDVKANTKGDANVAEITVFNLAEETKQQIAPDIPVLLDAGYSGDYGTIFIGKVEDLYDELVGADVKTTINCISDMSKFTGGSINKTYPANSKLTDIAKDQIQFAGMTNFKIDDNLKVFEKPKIYTSATTLKQNLTEISKNLDYEFSENKGSIMLIKRSSGVIEGFLLNSDSGLLDVRKVTKKEDKDKYDFDVKTLLIHRIAQSSIIELDSKISGNKICKVTEIEYLSNDQDHICNMKLKIL